MSFPTFGRAVCIDIGKEPVGTDAHPRIPFLTSKAG